MLSPLDLSSPQCLPDTGVDLSPSDSHHIAQNQDDRAGQRRSDRFENRKYNDPYRTSGQVEQVRIQPLPYDPRGGTEPRKKKKKKKKQIDMPMWEEVATPAIASGATADCASELISILSQGAASNLNDPSTLAWIDSMKTLVAGGSWADENSALVTNSLSSLVMRCKRSLEIVAGLEFMTIINMLQLAAKCGRYVVGLYLATPVYHETIIAPCKLKISQQHSYTTTMLCMLRGLPKHPHFEHGLE
jgi:hypothetical protein